MVDQNFVATSNMNDLVLGKYYPLQLDICVEYYNLDSHGLRSRLFVGAKEGLLLPF